MQIRFNKEIRKYREQVFFGLTLRQCAFCTLSMICSLVTYFSFNKVLSTEPLTWLCVIAAFPAALFGFVTYHDMYFEEVAMCFISSFIMSTRPMKYESMNIYETILEERRKDNRKEKFRKYAKNFKPYRKASK